MGLLLPVGCGKPFEPEPLTSVNIGRGAERTSWSSLRDGVEDGAQGGEPILDEAVSL
jgi:hypothetical protein